MKGGPLWLAHCPQPYFDPNPYYEDHPGPTYIPPKEKRKPVVKWITPSPSKWVLVCTEFNYFRLMSLLQPWMPFGLFISSLLL
jgi:hypothetical protein